MIKAIVLIALFRITLDAFSFRHATRLLRRLLERHPPVPDDYSPQELARAIRLASGNMLRDRPCLPQAMALYLLYQRRNIESRLRIGVKKTPDGKITAHAWVQHGPYVVIGALPDLHEYAVLPDLQI
ncbi:MAG: lasso peptide biosynthesis B2 protein [Bacteroidota bacterium]